MRFTSGVEALRKLIEAVGLNPNDPYTRLVIVCDLNGLPVVHATMYPTADSVLRVAETLRGVEVEVDTHHVVTLEIGEAK